jgi:hypothetical protein
MSGADQPARIQLDALVVSNATPASRSTTEACSATPTDYRSPGSRIPPDNVLAVLRHDCAPPE